MTDRNDELYKTAMCDLVRLSSWARSLGAELHGIFQIMNGMPEEYIDPVHATHLLQRCADARQLSHDLDQLRGWMMHYDQLMVPRREAKDAQKGTS